jgi:hypothetical protein
MMVKSEWMMVWIMWMVVMRVCLDEVLLPRQTKRVVRNGGRGEGAM